MLCFHLALYIYEELLVGPRAPLGVPTRKPFENFRDTVLRVLMRPVPVVFLRLAFSLQLSKQCQHGHCAFCDPLIPFGTMEQSLDQEIAALK